MVVADHIYSPTVPKFWKTNLATRIWAMWVFCHFLKFSSLIFLEITYNASLQQCLTSSRGKIQGKNVGVQIWAKISPETRFFAFSRVWFIVFLEIAYNDNLQQCITSCGDKTHNKKFLRTKFGLKLAKIEPNTRFSVFYLVWLISFPWNWRQWLQYKLTIMSNIYWRKNP